MIIWPAQDHLPVGQDHPALTSRLSQLKSGSVTTDLSVERVVTDNSDVNGHLPPLPPPTTADDRQAFFCRPASAAAASVIGGGAAAEINRLIVDLSEPF